MAGRSIASPAASAPSLYLEGIGRVQIERHASRYLRGAVGQAGSAMVPTESGGTALASFSPSAPFSSLFLSASGRRYNAAEEPRMTVKVIVSAAEWRRRTAGKRLDALGPRFKLPPRAQARTEQLLAMQKAGPLTRADRRELEALLREADEVMLRRAKAAGRVL